MCDRPSALYHRKNFDIVAANLDSHSGTRSALKLGDKDRNYLEIEWPEGGSLVVRSQDAYHDEIETATNEILRRAANRDSFYILLCKQAARNGWYYIHNQAEAKTYADITKANNIEIAKGVAAEFPKLAEVTGSVDISANATFTAPVLAKTGSVDISANATFTAPVLAKTGSVAIRENATFTAPVLAEVTGYVAIRENATFTAPVLAKTGSVDISANATFTAPVLAEVTGSVAIRENATFTAPKLKKKSNR